MKGSALMMNWYMNPSFRCLWNKQDVTDKLNKFVFSDYVRICGDKCKLIPL